MLRFLAFTLCLKLAGDLNDISFWLMAVALRLLPPHEIEGRDGL